MVRVTYTKSGKFEGSCQYGEQGPLKASGMRWNPDRKVWWTADVQTAALLEKFFDESAKVAFGAAEVTHQEALAASTAADSNVTVPAPDGQEYLPYQKAGIAYSATRKNTLIGDEMGLGKTVQAVGVWNATENLKSTLIVCPASLLPNWKREWQKWDVRGNKPVFLETDAGVLQGSNVVITSYDRAAKHLGALQAKQFDLLILDESHYIKNPKAARTKAIQDLHSTIQQKTLFLSGTPIVNRPIELWPMLQMAQPGGLGQNWKNFVERYCAGKQTKYGWEVTGSSNREELQEKLRATMMVRRLKADVLTELPDKRRQVIVLPADSKIIKAERDALKKAQEKAKAGVTTEENYVTDSLARGKIPEFAFEEISAIRHATAVAKLPMVIEHAREVLEEVGKIVIFAHHKDVIDSIKKEFGSAAVVLTGDTAVDDRQKAVDRFQTDATVKVFVGSIRAAGVGLTLTAASHVIFAESDWTPGAMDQAEDRCHRIGQKNAVLAQHLVVDGTIDAMLTATIVEKRAVMLETLNSPSVGTKGASTPLAGAKATVVTGKLVDVADLQDGARVLTIKRAGQDVRVPVAGDVFPDQALRDLLGRQVRFEPASKSSPVPHLVDLAKAKAREQGMAR